MGGMKHRSYTIEALKALDANDLQRMARSTGWVKSDRIFIARLLRLQADMNPAMLKNFGRSLKDRLGQITAEDALRLSHVLTRPVHEARSHHGLGDDRIDLARLDAGVRRLLEDFSAEAVRLYLAIFAEHGHGHEATEGSYDERLSRRARMLLHGDVLRLDAWAQWEVPTTTPEEEALDAADSPSTPDDVQTVSEPVPADAAESEAEPGPEPLSGWRARAADIARLREAVAAALAETARSLDAGGLPGPAFEEARRRFAEATEALVADMRAFLAMESIAGIDIDTTTDLGAAIDAVEAVLREREHIDDEAQERARQAALLAGIRSSIPPLDGFSSDVGDVIRTSFAALQEERLWSDEDRDLLAMLGKVGEVHAAARSSDTATAVRIVQDAPMGSPLLAALVEAAETNRWPSEPPPGDPAPAEPDDSSAAVVLGPQREQRTGTATPATMPAATLEPPTVEHAPGYDGLPDEDTVARCIEDGALGLAYWVARAGGWSRERYSVLAAAAYSDAIRSEDDDAASGYERFIDGFSIRGLEDNRGLQLLAFSAAVRATLLAPYRGASDVLAGLEGSVGDEAAVDLIAVLRRSIGVPILRGASDDDGGLIEDVERRIEATVADAREAAKSLPERNTSFQRAKNVWMRALRGSEPLGELLALVQADDRGRVEYVATRVHEVERSVDAIVDATDAALTGRGPKREFIVSKPREWLLGNFEEVLDLARRWIADVRQHQQLSSSTAGGITQRVLSLRSDLREAKDPVLGWFEREFDQADREGRALRSSGIAAARRSLEETFALVLDGTPLREEAGSQMDTLQRQVLRAIGVPFSEFVDRSERGDLDGWLGADRFATALETPLVDALEARVDEGEYRAALLLLEELVDEGGEAAQIVRLQALVEDRITGADHMLESRLGRCEENLSRARQQQHFSIHEAKQQRFDEEFRKLRGEVRRMMESRDHTLAFSAIGLFESRLQDELEMSRAALHEELTRTIVEKPAMATVEQRIRNAIDAGDLETARELMRLSIEGRALPVELERSEQGLARFTELVGRILPAFEQQAPGADLLLRSVGERRAPSEQVPIDFSGLSDEAQERGQRGLQEWFAVMDAENAQGGVRALGDGLDVAVRDILQLIGITVSPRHLSRRGGADGRAATWFEVEQARVSGAVTAHQFGSSAKGRYSVLLLSHRPKPDFIIERLGERAGEEPVVVLYLGVLGRMARQRFAQEVRQLHRRPAIVVDLVVAAMLAAGSGRLQDTLALTLPFSWLQPYKPAANAYVPPEVFAGRDDETRRILSPGETHFIYGGRQLGKSALLIAAQRAFGALGEERRTVYIDTKARQVGGVYPASHIIRVVAEHLERAGIPIVKVAGADEAELLRRSVLEWLDGDDRRQLLILLDEVDGLLEADAPSFAMVDYFKALYQDSNQRAKPIFAGLHSVQRFLAHPNNPFPHLGRHIEIGPLATRPATALVTEPLAALGLRFESADLVARFLRQTNYHPGLIQIHCETLVEHMARKSLKHDEPPQVITSADVYQVFTDPGLTGLVRERFDLTIGLDDRYRVIAYALALRALTEPMVEGIPVDVLLEDCTHYWPKGFPRHERTEFEDLLKEMVGLGVLAVDDSRRYVFRSPNIVELLGDEGQILQALDAAREKRLVQSYDLGVFRSLFRDRRLPLSEKAMRSIIGLEPARSRFQVILGSAATSSDIMLDAIQDSADSHELRRPRKTTVARLAGEIAKSDGERSATHLLIDLSAEDPDAVRASIERIRAGLDGSDHATVVVLVGPAALGAWTDLRILERDQGGPAITQLSRMSDASIQAWGRHIDRPLDDERALRAVREATGGWPVLIDDLYRSSQDGMPWSAALEATAARWREPDQAAAFVAQVGLVRDHHHGVLFDQVVQLGGALLLEELVEYFLAEPRFTGEDVRGMLDDLISLQVLDGRSGDEATGSAGRPVLTPEPCFAAAWSVTR
jgi:hypothetical protein